MHEAPTMESATPVAELIPRPKLDWKKKDIWSCLNKGKRTWEEDIF